MLIFDRRICPESFSVEFGYTLYNVLNRHITTAAFKTYFLTLIHTLYRVLGRHFIVNKTPCTRFHETLTNNVLTLLSRNLTIMRYILLQFNKINVLVVLNTFFLNSHMYAYYLGIIYHHFQSCLDDKIFFHTVHYLTLTHVITYNSQFRNVKSACYDNNHQGLSRSFDK
jgi:hypothetical protein